MNTSKTLALCMLAHFATASTESFMFGPNHATMIEAGRGGRCVDVTRIDLVSRDTNYDVIFIHKEGFRTISSVVPILNLRLEKREDGSILILKDDNAFVTIGAAALKVLMEFVPSFTLHKKNSFKTLIATDKDKINEETLRMELDGVRNREEKHFEKGQHKKQEPEDLTIPPLKEWRAIHQKLNKKCKEEVERARNATAYHLKKDRARNRQYITGIKGKNKIGRGSINALKRARAEEERKRKAEEEAKRKAKEAKLDDFSLSVDREHTKYIKEEGINWETTEWYLDELELIEGVLYMCARRFEEKADEENHTFFYKPLNEIKMRQEVDGTIILSKKGSEQWTDFVKMGADAFKKEDHDKKAKFLKLPFGTN